MPAFSQWARARKGSVSTPLQNQKAVEGRGSGADVPHQPGTQFQDKGRTGGAALLAELFPEIHIVVGGIRFGNLRILARCGPVEIPAFHHRAAKAGAVAADDLGERVHGNVRAPVKGVEYRRGCHRVVQHKGQAMVMGHPGDGFDVVHIATRIADGFRIDQPGILVDDLGEIGGIRGIHEPDLDAEPGQGVLKQRMGPAVEVGTRDNVLPGLGDAGHGIEHRGHAGSRAYGSGRAVNGGQAFFQHIRGGVHQPGVDIALFLQGEQIRGILGVAEHVTGGLVNGHGPGAGFLVRYLPRVQGQCFEMLLVLGHRMLLSVRAKQFARLYQLFLDFATADGNKRSTSSIQGSSPEATVSGQLTAFPGPVRAASRNAATRAGTSAGSSSTRSGGKK